MIIHRCVSQNADLFVPFFDGFIKVIWELLGSVDKANTSKYQDMIVSSLGFFSALCSKNIFRSVFSGQEIMQHLLEYVIVPNCMITYDINDQFESEPHEFVKYYEEVCLVFILFYWC